MAAYASYVSHVVVTKLLGGIGMQTTNLPIRMAEKLQSRTGKLPVPLAI